MSGSYLFNRLDDLFVLWLMYEPYQRVDLRVNWVLQNQGCQQIGKIRILVMLEANFDIEHIEPDYGIVYEGDEAFHFVDHPLEKPFLLLGER